VIRLEDGSVLRLNTDSRAVVRYSPGVREVRLDRGQALFEVAHDAARPFLVRADGTTVRALGTVFDVRRRGDDVGVTLLQGVVQVSTDAGGTEILHPNQRLEVVGDAVRAPVAEDVKAATSWTHRRLTFKALPLGEAVAEVNRYSDRKVELAAADLRGAPVNGVFETGDTKGFAAAVAQVFDLKLAETPKGDLVLTRPGAPAPEKN
jgi:transmembrane sensor